MGDSKNINATNGRLMDNLNLLGDYLYNSKNIPQQIDDAVKKNQIRTGVIKKFYPYLDKAEVKLDYNGMLVLCKILHRYGGDMIDFYTPLSYEEDFDDKLKEPYIVPKAENHVCVLSINDADSLENLILGYYNNEEIVGYNPAKPGNLKLMYMGEDNLYWIKFGKDGFDYRLYSEPTMEVGDLKSNMEKVEYVNTDVMNEEYYSKEDVNDILKGYETKFKMLKSFLNIIIYDGGVKGNSDNSFVYNGDYIDLIVDNDGTSIINNDEDNFFVCSLNNPLLMNDNDKHWSSPLVVEFDVLNIDGLIEFQLYKSNDSGDFVSVNLKEILNNNNKISARFKFIYKDNNFQGWIDGIKFRDINFNFNSSGLMAIRFVLSEKSTFKYKELIVT